MRRLTGSLQILPFFVCLLTVFVIGCASEERFTGTYEEVDSGLPSDAETILELKENGEGTWRVDDDEVSFSWYLKGEELRFNTKNGGVIVGKIHGDTVEVVLPGDRTMSFKKSQ